MEALFWLLLEAGVALAILIFIVWWTLPRRKSDDKSDSTDARQKRDSNSRFDRS